MLTEDVGAIYKNYYHDLYNYIYFLTLNTHDTEDILQNVFIKILRNHCRFRGDSTVKTWIYSIAHNECINYRNKYKKENVLEDYSICIMYAKDNVEKTILDKEHMELILRFIHSKKEPVRSLLLLRLLEERPFTEIGTIIGQSDVWCRVTFFRLKKELVDILEYYGKDVI